MSAKSYQRLVAEARARLLSPEELQALWSQQALAMSQQIQQDFANSKVGDVSYFWQIVDAWREDNFAFIGARTTVLPIKGTPPLVEFPIGKQEPHMYMTLQIWVTEDTVHLSVV